MTDFDLSAQLFSQAAVLMMVGMGFVFAFLSLLIVVIKIMISPLATRFPDPVAPIKKKPSTSNADSASIIAAISAAVSQYRNKYK